MIGSDIIILQLQAKDSELVRLRVHELNRDQTIIV